MYRNLNWRPDFKDHRDLLYYKNKKLALNLPKLVDLRPQMPPIVDQGELGSCTANALAGHIGFLKLQAKQAFTASRLFIYYNERAVEGDVGTDGGAQIRDGIKTLHALGVCQETEWPYVVTRFKVKPPAPCYSAATPNVITSYLKITALVEMQDCLASGYPFVFGIPVYESFYDANKTGTVPMPKSGEKLEGGHALLCVGYDATKKQFIFRNSWGKSWGLSGYGTIPFDYMTKMASDCWTIRAES